MGLKINHECIIKEDSSARSLWRELTEIILCRDPLNPLRISHLLPGTKKQQKMEYFIENSVYDVKYIN